MKCAVLFVSVLALIACAKNQDAYEMSDVSSERITQGLAVQAGDLVARHTVLVGDLNANNEIDSTCTGTLIAQDLVLTAAHCLENASGVLIEFSTDPLPAMYRFDQTHLMDPNLGVVSRVFAQHPSYGKMYFNKDTRFGDPDDIALVLLPHPAPSNYVPALYGDLKINTDDEIIIAGYGRQFFKQKFEEEDFRLRSAGNKIDNYNDYTLMIDQAQAGGLCPGDSGGPTFIKDAQGRLHIVGINRAILDPRKPEKDPCFTTGYATRVDAFMDWIRQTAQKWRKN